MYPLRKIVENFFTAKALGIILMVTIIPAVFYTYTAFTEGIPAVDIASFIIAAIIGQLVTYKLYKQTRGSKLTEVIAIVVIILLSIIFVTFTFYPPHLPIFLDLTTCQYGIP
jgi:peptidoglycan/LPS O-acetylase OafA/YrhL